MNEIRRTMKRAYLIYILTSFTWMVTATTGRPAMVIVPVADLVGAPIQTFYLGKTIKESYAKIGYCGAAPKPTQGTPRIHQLLLHQLVEIVSENGDEVCIIIPQVFFITHAHHKPQAMYWTLKKNLISLEKLGKQKANLEKVPQGPSYKNPHDINNTPNTVVLLKPFFDPITNQTLSAGTRFMVDTDKKSDNLWAVFVYDRKVSGFKTSYIPRDRASLVSVRSPQEAIACFVILLKQWAHCHTGPIPYVWGGCSFTHCCNHPFKETKKRLANGSMIAVYARPDCSESPISGFDCAGLITLAAQICGIPYYFKNTYTLAHYLKSLSIDQHLQEGDLIWIPGHVMIVSDISHNKIIEARGYPSNYGIVHEIPLQEIFKGIKTYQDLIKAYHYQTKLVRLNKEGEEVEEISRYKILKLSSAWDTTSF